MVTVYDKEIRYFLDAERNFYPYLKWLRTLEECARYIIYARLNRIRNGNYGDINLLAEES
ncbi:MAG: hypothetical protein LBP39_00355 [Rickettsiales bacterium]|jgi:putative component of toxin-antitoxin plasmid stabilization module|nr:hypothetical protein [Rickettsiales bacterium]